jgi:tetratricopeptide (TPR) repeat protein
MAVKILTSLDADYPRMPITKFRLGQALLKEGSTARGMALLDLAIQIAPDFEEALLLRAELHLKAGDAMSAWMSMRKLLESRPRSTIAKMMLARAYSGAGLFDQASDLYRERIAASPDDYRPHLLLGLIERERGNMTDAREAFRTAHDLNPNDPTATIRLVELDLSESKLDAARLWVEQLLARDPESATVHYLEALISRAEGLDGKAEKALKTCLGLDLNYSLAYNLLIEILLADGRLEEAHRELQEVIARDPGDISSLLLAASLEQGLEDFPSARQRYETILKIDPNVPVAQNNLAFLYLDKFERPEEAYELIIRARSTLPEDPLIADTFGWVLFHRGDYRKAQVVLEECAVALPSHHEIQYHVGRARLMNGDFKRALAALEVAIAAKFPFSGSDEAARLRGLLLTLTSDPPPGIDELQKLADANPSDIAPDLMLASSHEESGRFAESAEACLQALTINPDLFPAHTMLARLYAGPLAALEKALHHAKNAHALAPQDPMVAATLGRIAYKTGNHDLAINLLRESIQDQPDRPEVLYPLAYATYRIGQIEQAFSIMQRALETELEEPRRLEMSAFLRMLELHQPARADLESANREIDEVLKRDPDDLPARMARAAIAAADGEHESAAAVYRNELALYPAFPLAQRELAGILARPGKGQDLEAAVRLIREARKRLPADVRTATIRAEISYRQGNHDYAIRSLEGLDRQGSLTPEGIAVLGLARIAGGRVGDGKSDLKRAVDAGLRGPLLQDVHKARRP